MIIYGMCITTVRKNVHTHEKTRQLALNLQNTRPKINQMIRLKNQTPYPIRDLIEYAAFSISTGSARLEGQFLGTAP